MVTRALAVGQEGLQTYIILKSLVKSFRLMSVLLPEVSGVRDWDVTSVIIINGPPYIEPRGDGGREGEEHVSYAK
jgi:hypothetical protein